MSLSPNQQLGIQTGEAPVSNVVAMQAVEPIRRHTVWVTDSNTAATAVGEKEALYVDATYMPNGIQVLQVNWLPGLAVTAHASNNATVVVASRLSTGGTGATISTQTTTSGGSGSLSAFVVYQAGVTTAANAFVAAGKSVTVKITKAASGVKMAAAAAAAGDLFGVEIVYQIL